MLIKLLFQVPSVAIQRLIIIYIQRTSSLLLHSIVQEATLTTTIDYRIISSGRTYKQTSTPEYKSQVVIIIIIINNNNIIMHSQTRQTSNQLSAYAIFLILERQRNLKLRELYHNNPVVDTLLPVISEESSSSPSSPTNSTTTTSRKSSLRQAMKHKKKNDASSNHNIISTLPRFPPRYQALSNIITSDVLMMQLRTTTTSQRSSSRHRSSSPSSSSQYSYSSSSFYMEEYKHLDQVTKQFLNDTAMILQERCMEEVENNQTMLEIHMKQRSMNRRRMVGSKKKLFSFRVEKKLSLIVD